jgi:hypothetical protein
MTAPIKNFLTTYLAHEKNWKAHLLANWKTIIGNLADRVTLEKIYDDLLTLGVNDSSWLQELYLLSPIILETINANLDQPRIKHLRFKQIGRKKEIKKINEKKIEQINTIDLKKKEQIALDAIQDEQLREFLKKYLIRCYQEKL